MNFSIISRFALAPFAVAAVVSSLGACSGDDVSAPATDSGTQGDTAMTPDTSTPIKDSGTTRDSGTNQDAGTNQDSGTLDSGTKDAGPAATWTQVHTELAANCATCHTTGGSGGHNMGGADIASAYADSQKAALNAECSGKTKGACAGIRVRSGSMPLGKTLSASEKTRIANIIDSWVAGGQKGP